MVEYDRHSQRDDSGKPALRTCIVGIGGAGSNVLDRITLDRTVEANLVCMHTDIRVLGHAMAPTKIQLGAELMRGVGAGGDPDLGREAAMFSREEIRQAIEGHDIVFICAGLGGGTGSGAAPVIAEIAKATNALVFVTATMPFSFEGRRRLSQAEEALLQLQKRADALILFENNRMGELILPKDGIQKAFAQADQLIAQSLRAVSTIVSMPGLVKLGLDDLTSALSTSNGRCLFGFGESKGQNRGTEALKRALKSPLIDQGRLLHQTKTLLVHIAGGETLTLLEVDAIMKQLGRHVPDHTHILFGVAVDAKLGDSIAVTLISSLGLTQLNTVAAAAPPADMLPMKDRPMPSLAESVVSQPPVPAPAPVPPPAPASVVQTEPQAQLQPQAAPVAPAPAPAPRQRVARPAPVPAVVAEPEFIAEPQTSVVNAAPAPSPAQEDAMNLLFKDDEIIALAPSAPALATDEEDPFPEMFPELKAAPRQAAPAPASVPTTDPDAEEYYDDEEAPSADHGSFAPEDEPEPAPAPARDRPRIEDFINSPPPVIHKAPSSSPLAAVVGRTSSPAAPESTPAPAPAPAATQPPAAVQAPAPVSAPAPAPAAKKQAAAEQQIDLGFSDGDRGRFKDTEPSIASGGEDLDVPTWMRLKRKLKR